MALEDHINVSDDSDIDEQSPSPPPTTHTDEFPGNLNGATSEWKKGDDWLVLHNPQVPRSLEISLVYSFDHESVVCCVRFSKDGMFLATGCNHTTQIFDLRTGSLVSTLNDESVNQTGDLYIRDVCFSPDGKYVATAAEDGLVRVRLFLFYSTPSLVRPSNPRRMRIDMGYQPTIYLSHLRRAWTRNLCSGIFP